MRTSGRVVRHVDWPAEPANIFGETTEPPRSLPLPERFYWQKRGRDSNEIYAIKPVELG